MRRGVKCYLHLRLSSTSGDVGDEDLVTELIHLHTPCHLNDVTGLSLSVADSR